MRYFFFDFAEDGEQVSDQQGMTFENFADAKAQALRALGEIASENLSRGKLTEIALTIRTGEGAIAYRATLVIKETYTMADGGA